MLWQSRTDILDMILNVNCLASSAAAHLLQHAGTPLFFRAKFRWLALGDDNGRSAIGFQTLESCHA